MGEARSWDSRVAEYVDAPYMKHRLRIGDKLVVRIEGRSGRYKTEWDPKARRGHCSCPSDADPCKHVVALQQTWKLNPKSFIDLEASIRAWLAKKSPEDLYVFLERLMVESPTRLRDWGIVPHNAFRGAASEEE